MNLWIAQNRDELLETIRNWDFLLVNDSEARMLVEQHNLRRAAQKILDLGPHTLVIKRGEHGAMLFRQGHIIRGARLLAGRCIRSHWRRRLLCRWIRRLLGRARI